MLYLLNVHMFKDVKCYVKTIMDDTHDRKGQQKLRNVW